MRQTILQMLEEQAGHYVSGEEISDLLQVSRTAVWKQIQALKKTGYQIDSATGKGYLLVERPDLLIPWEIKRGLATEFLGQELLCFAEVTSTNEKAKEVALAGAPEGMVVVAEKQLAGRGRLARSWSSPAGLGLWFSLILRPPLEPAQTPQLTFVSAVAVCQALRKATGLDLRLKWPNDLLWQGRKVSGILTELGAEIAEVNYVVVGIGLNVNQTESDFIPEIRERASSLALAGGRTWSRVSLLQALLEEYEKQYQLYLSQGFGPILEAWRELNITLGREVTVNTREARFVGVAEEIDHFGCLLVRKDSGELVTLIAADVSLREEL